jgi:hypothetical protein
MCFQFYYKRPVMEVKSTPTFDTSITLTLPRHMTLPAQTDAQGHIVPATGFVWQKYLNYDTLLALGVSIEWQHVDGHKIPLEEAKRLIQAATDRDALAQAQEQARGALQA